MLACCSLALALTVDAAAYAADTEMAFAVRSWTSEQFGSDVAILRSDDAASGQGSRTVGFLVSCSGPDRRFRLSLPDVISRGAAGGLALIATDNPNDRTRAIIRFSLANASSVLVSTGTLKGRDIAAAIGHMLLEKPHALDVMLSVGSGPVAFTNLKLVRVLLTLRPEDTVAVTRFVDACDRYPAARND